MDKAEIYFQLNEQRDIALNGAEVASNKAWLKIDRLLDCLNELNALGVEVETI